MKSSFIYVALLWSILAQAEQPWKDIEVEHPESYAKSRLALASQPGFNGYKLTMIEMQTQSESQKLLNDKKINEAISKQLALLYVYPLSIFGNTIVGETYAWVSKDPNIPQESKSYFSNLSKQYLLKADSLIQSITNGTECTAIENQCKVINIKEEDMVLRKLGYKKTGQELLIDVDKKFAFDKLTGINAKGESKYFYFDIWLLTPGNPNSVPLTPDSSGTPNGAP